MFLEEFSELLSQYADSRNDAVYIGDFNFHYNNNNVHLSCAHQRAERSHDTY